LDITPSGCDGCCRGTAGGQLSVSQSIGFRRRSTVATTRLAGYL